MAVDLLVRETITESVQSEEHLVSVRGSSSKAVELVNQSFHLKDWIKSCPVVDWKLPCQELITLFRQRTDVECVVVCQENNKPIGLIMKHVFFRKLGSLYGVSLYSDKQSSFLMDNHALQAEVDIQPQELIDNALSRSEDTLYDAVIITENQKFIGVLTVNDMLNVSRLLQNQAIDKQIQTVSSAESMIGDIRETVDSVMEKARYTYSCTEKINSMTEQGKNQLELMMQGFQKWTDYANKQETSVGDLLDRMKSASGITGLIGEIADQTNLLAVNATIEAARAGEHGRGFAIVADEIRLLADQTKKSVGQIRKLLQAMGEAAEVTAQLVIEGKKGALTGIHHVEQARHSFAEMWNTTEENAKAAELLTLASAHAYETTLQVSKEFDKLSTQILR
ncbi:methyl-accepting chemotaxis protein [Cohnella sp.]|uniref:methyl-accepting chemotaxis protein n=1 Tax=Cohnella sp. TaxID=1883426 RepID=UPI00356526D0